MFDPVNNGVVVDSFYHSRKNRAVNSLTSSEQSPSMAREQRHARWRQRLREARAQGTEFCPELPAIAERWEQWWHFAAERPLLIASAPTRTDIYRGKAFHLLDDPDRWLAAQRLQLENTHFVADTLPKIRVDIGPVSLAAFLGAPLTVSEHEQTSWQEPTITDWDNPPDFAFDPGNRWFTRVISLLGRLADDARGRYVVCTPDLAGAIDALVNMRSPGEMCLDLFDNRAAVIRASMQVMDAWEHIFTQVMDTVLERGAGLTQWLSPWSDEPFTIPTCDFTALIGREDFVECCLPSLRRQGEIAGRLLYHLDGPQAARHAPTLAAESCITAVQYTPGAGTPSALAKLDLLRELQEAGKPILVITPKHEVAELAKRLDRRGAAILVEDRLTPAEADELAEVVRTSA